ncbi:hypothetical protein Thiosp_03664 [Thiorhodovibrio litoralis]|nr:hypothetical protein Thiosp_03664 [Thiorhodovibrio litoralis]
MNGAVTAMIEPAPVNIRNFESQAATRMVARIQVDSRIHIEPQSRETFDAGFSFFRARGQRSRV